MLCQQTIVLLEMTNLFVIIFEKERQAKNQFKVLLIDKYAYLKIVMASLVNRYE
jgi:hypothetical protein